MEDAPCVPWKTGRGSGGGCPFGGEMRNEEWGLDDGCFIILKQWRVRIRPWTGSWPVQQIATLSSLHSVGATAWQCHEVVGVGRSFFFLLGLPCWWFLPTLDDVISSVPRCDPHRLISITKQLRACPCCCLGYQSQSRLNRSYIPAGVHRCHF